MRVVNITNRFGEIEKRVVPNCSHPIVIDKHDGFGRRAFPCGKCPRCRSYIRSIWNYRLNVAKFSSDMSLFCTLTYDDDHLSDYFIRDNIKRYHKRLRKALNSHCAHLSYYFTSEYGSKTHRPHHHALYFFSFDPRHFTNLLYDGESGDPVHAEQCGQNYFTFVKDPFIAALAIQRSWPYGFVDVSYVSSARVNYITHYHTRPKFPRPLNRHKVRRPFVMSSKSLGWDPDVPITYRDGVPFIFDTFNNVWIVLPTYYRRKMGISLDSCVYLTPDDMYDNPQDVLFLKSRSQSIDNKYNLEHF